MEGMRNACDILFGKPVRNSPFGKPGCRWEDKIKIGLEGADWICGTRGGLLWMGNEHS